MLREMSDKGDSVRAAKGADTGPGHDDLMCRALHRGSSTPAPVRAPIQGLTTPNFRGQACIWPVLKGPIGLLGTVGNHP